MMTACGKDRLHPARESGYAGSPRARGTAHDLLTAFVETEPHMLACLLAVTALRQSPVTMPTLASWDGKVWAGVALGTSENDLGKQVPKSKTVGPDPASVRIGVDRKGWILA